MANTAETFPNEIDIFKCHVSLALDAGYSILESCTIAKAVALMSVKFEVVPTTRGGNRGEGAGGCGYNNATCRTCTPRKVVSEAAVAFKTAAVTEEAASGETPTSMLTDAALMEAIQMEDTETFATSANF